MYLSGDGEMESIDMATPRTGAKRSNATRVAGSSDEMERRDLLESVRDLTERALTAEQALAAGTRGKTKALAFAREDFYKSLESDPRLVVTDELSRKIRRHEETLYRWVRAGRLKAHRYPPDKRLFFWLPEVARCLREIEGRS
jgi:hypothetical protein